MGDSRSASGDAPVGVGVIGCGYWGPNLVRNFYQLNGSSVVAVADLDAGKLERIAELYPSVETTTDHEQLLKDDRIEAIVLAVPVALHARLGLEALEAGKHVLIEKPLAASAAQCESLIEQAEARKRILMVGHVFEYTPAVARMKTILETGTLGQLYYVHSQRLNLGLLRNDVNVIWDLAPHDFSILLHVLGGKLPRSVQACGAAHINPKVEDVAQVTLEFDDNLVAYVQASWLDPKKVREMVLVGSEKMLVYDDIQPNDKIWLYDRAVEGPTQIEDYSQFAYTYRYGDITIPRIGGGEPLRAEAQAFIDAIRTGEPPITDGHSGLRVVRILEATDASLRESGRRIEL